MKEKKFTTLINRSLLLILVVISSINVGYGQIVGYNLYNNELSSNGLAANHPGGVFSTTATNLVFVGDAAMTDGWDSGTPGGFKYYTISPFSTVGYYSIKVSSKLYSDATGPRDFLVQYKIGAGGTWTQAGIITATTSTTQYQVDLPSECRNVPELYIRWISTSYSNTIGGDIDVGAVNFISDISITGILPQTPTSQASAVSIVSVTPTTITIDCTPGNGDSRIIVISNALDFKSVAGSTPIYPTDDNTYTGNINYNGSGQQVIYSGTGTKVTVNVPDSKNIYYFKVYDYFANSGLTRYIYSDANNNPKQCALEIITPNAAKDLRLTSATLGATISEPLRSNIILRGIVWRTSPGVLENDNKINVTGIAGTVGGLFEKVYSAGTFPKSTTIYYKGFVRNQSGTIYSAESSFTNNPIFTGTGTWETASNWNVQEVPGTNGSTYGSITDSPLINGSCTVGASHSCTDLSINSSGSITIQPGITLNVGGILSNTRDAGIVIKSNSTDPNGSLIFASGTPNATVEMYSKASWNLANPSGSKYKWQFFGVPVSSTTVSGSFSGNYIVRKYEESSPNDTTLWIQQGSSLSSGTGYEVSQSTPTTYAFRGQLVNSNFTRSLPYTTGAKYAGQHIFGNPFTAAIDIDKIQFGGNTEQAIYQYNTGSYNDWDTNGGGTTASYSLAITPGQYSVSTPNTAGSLGLLRQIPSMQGFLVKATANSGQITIPYSAVISNTAAQRSKGTTNPKIATRIDLTGTHYNDYVWIFTDSTCTRNFDNGWDGRKLIGSSQVSQLYAVENDGNYQIDAVNNMNNSYLALQPGNDTQFKMIFYHQNIESAYSKISLVDLVANKTIDITQDGTEYAFTTTPTDIVNRFKIVTQDKLATAQSTINTDQKLKIYNTECAILLQNLSSGKGEFTLYTTNGKMIQKSYIEPNSKKTISTNSLLSGVYIVKAVINSEQILQKLVIR